VAVDEAVATVRAQHVALVGDSWERCIGRALVLGVSDDTLAALHVAFRAGPHGSPSREATMMSSNVTGCSTSTLSAMRASTVREIDKRAMVAFRATTPIVTVLLVLLACAGCSRAQRPACGFLFDQNWFELPTDLTTRLTGPMTHEDHHAIERISCVELQRAFADFNLSISDNSNAFWRVRVMHDVPPQSHAAPGAGESLALGPLGGAGFVDFVAVAFGAVRYAPKNALRQQIVEAMGRGIGHVAVHEFGHQILGPAAAHDNSDENAYEYGSPERQSEY
jgi:hypothetical protein